MQRHITDTFGKQPTQIDQQSGSPDSAKFGCTGERTTAYPDGINQVKDVE
jgi:hypothetical protein